MDAATRRVGAVTIHYTAQGAPQVVHNRHNCVIYARLCFSRKNIPSVRMVDELRLRNINPAGQGILDKKTAAGLAVAWLRVPDLGLCRHPEGGTEEQM